MARIAGVNIPTNKRVIIALTYIHGIGDRFAREIVEKVGIPMERRVNELSDSEVLQIRETIDRDYQVEGDLRRETSMNIKRCVTVVDFQSADSARTPMPAPVRVRQRPSLVKRNRVEAANISCWRLSPFSLNLVAFPGGAAGTTAVQIS